MGKLVSLVVLMMVFSGPVWATAGSCDGTNDCNTYSIGNDPGIGKPVPDGTTSTETTILTPLLSMLPALSKFAVPAHDDVCPTVDINLFDTDFTMDAQCTIAEGIRATLSPVCVCVWIAVALFVVMAA